MKLLSDLLPLIAFFAAWQITDNIFVATAILMVAMTIQVAIIYIKGNTVDPVLKGSYLLVILFGALTLFFRSEEFIQWKPSILYFGLAVTLLTFLTFSKQDPLQKLFLPIFPDFKPPTTICCSPGFFPKNTGPISNNDTSSYPLSWFFIR